MGYDSSYTGMKLSLALLLTLLACSVIIASQESAEKPIPSAVPATQDSNKTGAPPTSAPQSSPKDTAQAGPAQAPAPPDYSQEAYVIEFYRQSMRFENDGTGSDQTEARIRVVSESGVQALGQLKIGYSALSDKLDIAYVRVRKPDGSVINAQESAVQDLTIPDAPVYTDYHQKHISVPALRPGDVLEYQFVRNIATPLSPGQFWTSFNFADKGIVLDEQLEINVPKARQLKLKHQPEFVPKITEEGDRRLYHWTYSHLENEDDSAASKKKNKNKRKTRKDEDEIPSVQLTTFQSWQELGAWYASLEHDRRIPDAAVKAKADELTKDKTDNLEKVKALYEFVSRDFRYVSLSLGLGRYQPHAAAEVFANGYGDCKDKNTLLAAMLSAEGFQSTSVLIGSQHKLDPEIPSPSQFDHVITRVPVNGKDIWLDSTNGVAPFRMLASPLRDKEALAIPPDGPALLVKTPADLPFDSYDRTDVAGSINETGKLTAHVSMSARGDAELALRFALRQTPSNKWKDFFEFVMRRYGMKGAEIANLKVGDPSNSDVPLRVDFDVTENNYFDWSAAESKIPLPLNILLLPEADEDDDSATAKPIKLGSTKDSTLDVKLTIPGKYTVHLPIAVDVKRDYAEYHSTYKYDAGQLAATRAMRVMAKEVPAGRVGDYAAFRRAVGTDQAQQVSLENKAPGSTGVGANESADDLNDSAIQALRNQHYELAAQLFERVVELEPKHKAAWNNLGLAYMELHQNTKAIDAFKKQIEINAYDEYAYNNLGRIYEQEQRYDEAALQFQKQIEINPLDHFAHASLGLLYIKQKKYAEAIPEMEKAVEIQPKNALLQISLGQAYMATKQTDKGMAAFDKAIGISPTPLTWNNIAYTLCEQNVQLDRAEKYSDAAINAVETQLRDVNLDNLRLQDFGTATLLFSMWDTKGWILYKRGDANGAVKYLLPSWQGSGRGEVAQHLGEIAEKRGKRDEAVGYYIESLAVEDVGPEARDRLIALGATKNLDRKIEEARQTLPKQRARPLDQTGAGSADFFLLVSPAKVEQAKFAKGDDGLKAIAESLPKADVGMTFPDGWQVHVPRRATVHCGTEAPVKATKQLPADGKAAADVERATPGPCTLQLWPADDVRSMD
jgi:tetratricopeptide (TPR) repeat protein